MAVDIKHYIGAFMDAYNGPFSGLWAGEVANIYTGLESLTTIIPQMDSPANLVAWTGSRVGATPTNVDISLTTSAFAGDAAYPIDNYNLDTIGVYENNVRELARKARYHFNSIATTLISANGTCFDGVNFFATTHPIVVAGSGTTQKNLITSSDYAELAVVDKTKPTDVEMAAILIKVFGHLISLKDKQGDEANGEDCRSVDVFTGDINKYVSMLKVVATTVLSDRTDNPLAGLSDVGIKIKPILVPALTGDNIYMFRTDGIVKPLILGEVYAEPKALGPETEYAILNRKVLFAYDAVRGGCYGKYSAAVKATLSNAS